MLITVWNTNIWLVRSGCSLLFCAWNDFAPIYQPRFSWQWQIHHYTMIYLSFSFEIQSSWFHIPNLSIQQSKQTFFFKSEINSVISWFLDKLMFNMEFFKRIVLITYITKCIYFLYQKNVFIFRKFQSLIMFEFK